ncbi:MAG: hypothetical protein IIB66_07775 [Proteobacteria bacterium]|nr:hypothetical protein [Pseudomonadota bacterium]
MARSASPDQGSAGVAARDDTLVVAPATLPEEALRARIIGVDAVVIIKVGRHLDKVRRLLDGLDLAANAHYIEHATMADQRIAPLAEAGPRAPYFSMVVVHRRGEAWL